MASKVFLDVNILLDLTLQREHFPVARNIMELAVNGRIQAFISPSILHICGYYLTKEYGNVMAKKILLSIMTDITSIDISHESVIAAMHSSVKDMETALQYYNAIQHKLDYFISRDKQLLRESIAILPIYTPEEFVKEMQGE